LRIVLRLAMLLVALLTPSPSGAVPTQWVAKMYTEQSRLPRAFPEV
jgi:hypothetical protein